MKQDKENRRQRGIAYLRVSTEDQNLGPEAQRAAIEKWAASEDVEIAEVFQDHGVSGGAPVDKRPGLLSAIEALNKKGPTLLVVAKRDRLARDLYACAMIEHLVEKKKGQIRSADGSGNGDSPEDHLMKGIKDLFAQHERIVIKARTRAALAVKRARGEKTGGTRPYGYRVIDGAVKTLEEDPDEQRAVELIAELRDRGYSLRKIAAELNTRGIPSTTGGAWIHTAVKKVCDRIAA
jgi:DNA invertase Pin-like site-specific DNA recombinase